MRLLFGLLVFIQATSYSQITNGGFEILQDSVPSSWNITKPDGFQFSIDNSIKKTGKNSIKLESINSKKDNFIVFSQKLNYETSSLKRITISAFVKSSNVIDHGGLVSRTYDKEGKLIWANEPYLEDLISGSTDWQKISMQILIRPNCKRLSIGGYLTGKGSIWFDDITLVEMGGSNQPTNEIEWFTYDLIRKTKKHSLYSDSLNWNLINLETKMLMQGMATASDQRFIASYMIGKLREVGDNHTSVLSRKALSQYIAKNLDGRQPSSRLIEGNIGYVNVPGFMSSNDTSSQHFAQRIQDMIQELDKDREIKGWIIDLRENSGGNLHPMIVGLGSLLGNNELGHFTNPRTKQITKWSYRDGISKEGRISIRLIKNPYFVKNPETKIAVLVGPRTGSSGEFTAISFLGMSNVKVFGQPSAGYVTSNKGFMLGDGSMLMLAISYPSDRTGKSYLKKINPDALVENGNEIAAAQAWINEK